MRLGVKASNRGSYYLGKADMYRKPVRRMSRFQVVTEVAKIARIAKKSKMGISFQAGQFCPRIGDVARL